MERERMEMNRKRGEKGRDKARARVREKKRPLASVRIVESNETASFAPNKPFGVQPNPTQPPSSKQKPLFFS